MLQGSWRVTGKLFRDGIQLDPSAHDDLLQQRHGALPGDIEVSRQNPVGNDDHGLVGMAALADVNLLHLQILRDLGLADGNPGKLDIVVPDAVIDGIVAHHLAGQGPVHAGRVENDGKGLGVLRPGHELAGIVQKQDLRALLVHGNLDFLPGLFLNLVFDEVDDVGEGLRGDSGAWNRPSAAGRFPTRGVPSGQCPSPG